MYIHTYGYLLVRIYDAMCILKYIYILYFVCVCVSLNDMQMCVCVCVWASRPVPMVQDMRLHSYFHVSSVCWQMYASLC